MSTTGDTGDTGGNTTINNNTDTNLHDTFANLPEDERYELVKGWLDDKRFQDRFNTYTDLFDDINDQYIAHSANYRKTLIDFADANFRAGQENQRYAIDKGENIREFLGETQRNRNVSARDRQNYNVNVYGQTVAAQNNKNVHRENVLNSQLIADKNSQDYFFKLANLSNNSNILGGILNDSGTVDYTQLVKDATKNFVDKTAKDGDYLHRLLTDDDGGVDSSLMPKTLDVTKEEDYFKPDDGYKKITSQYKAGNIDKPFEKPEDLADKVTKVGIDTVHEAKKSANYSFENKDITGESSSGNSDSSPNKITQIDNLTFWGSYVGNKNHPKTGFTLNGFKGVKDDGDLYTNYQNTKNKPVDTIKNSIRETLATYKEKNEIPIPSVKGKEQFTKTLKPTVDDNGKRTFSFKLSGGLIDKIYDEIYYQKAFHDILTFTDSYDGSN